jgi:hypothetical protein
MKTGFLTVCLASVLSCTAFAGDPPKKPADSATPNSTAIQPLTPGEEESLESAIDHELAQSSATQKPKVFLLPQYPGGTAMVTVVGKLFPADSAAAMLERDTCLTMQTYVFGRKDDSDATWLKGSTDCVPASAFKLKSAK